MDKPNSIQVKTYQKFADGYNAKVQSWNEDKSDGGKCPVRGIARCGYEAARDEIARRQFAKETNIKLVPITAEQAAKMWEGE